MPSNAIAVQRQNGTSFARGLDENHGFPIPTKLQSRAEFCSTSPCWHNPKCLLSEAEYIRLCPAKPPSRSCHTWSHAGRGWGVLDAAGPVKGAWSILAFREGKRANNKFRPGERDLLPTLSSRARAKEVNSMDASSDLALRESQISPPTGGNGNKTPCYRCPLAVPSDQLERVVGHSCCREASPLLDPSCPWRDRRQHKSRWWERRELQLGKKGWTSSALKGSPFLAWPSNCTYSTSPCKRQTP